MEVTPMNAHLMDSFPGYRGCSARRASTRGVSPLEQEPKNYARELEWSLHQYTILPPTGRAKYLARYR